ncbi:glycosyltransferase [Sporosarcina gallistercoris]|uniref:Glycosyltransferase n=1 Tax=Sporosarcina gallistercoris TaxID=2762245 RepID=A0ABR8PML6_9BACL|nr:glycosyltransferase [Sporosarcina gallistercoris]MBD7909418.1 glycosyltransferase [Sporosarcina gallistercoris]
MNILYITKLTGNMWAGPNNSVPAQIAAQSKYDNVFWYNINKVAKEGWSERKYYNNLKDFPSKRIKDLPTPFNNPDIVIFEGVYEYPFNSLIYEVWKRKIPYIIVPRSALTEKAQKSSVFKKKIGNFLFFERFVKKATAIHYLTKREWLESKIKWPTNYFIIPNGIDDRGPIQKNNEINKLKGIYIGRIELYQKGLNVLIQACSEVKEDLRRANCTIELYGPDRDESKLKLLNIIQENDIEDLVFVKDSIFKEEKEKVQLNADFFIMTSRFEGHPMGLIEALSFGLPALVTEGTNMREEIVSANAGWGADMNSYSIASALKEIVEENSMIREKGSNGKLLSLNYNWDKLAETTREAYRKLINLDVKI